MSKRSRILVSLGTVAGALLAVGLGFGACAQEAGERCQRTSDCAEGLTCNLGTQLCQAMGSGGLMDAGVDVPLDAENDAAPDAAIDAP
jgi:hypothetical protein